MAGILENDRYRRAFGLPEGEFRALLAIYVLSAEHPTTVKNVGALVARVHGTHPATVNYHAIRLERLGLVQRTGRCAGSVVYALKERGVRKVREWLGEWEQPAAAE